MRQHRPVLKYYEGLCELKPLGQLLKLGLLKFGVYSNCFWLESKITACGHNLVTSMKADKQVTLLIWICAVTFFILQLIVRLVDETLDPKVWKFFVHGWDVFDPVGTWGMLRSCFKNAHLRMLKAIHWGQWSQKRADFSVKVWSSIVLPFFLPWHWDPGTVILEPRFITVMRQSCIKTRLDYLSLNSQDPLMWTDLAPSLHKWKHVKCKLPWKKRKRKRNTRPRCLRWLQQRHSAALNWTFAGCLMTRRPFCSPVRINIRYS